MLSKAEEIELIKGFSQTLGPNSYLGPALVELMPLIESDIRSDFEPDLVSYIKRLESHADGKAREIADLEAKFKDISEKLAAKEASLRLVTATLDNVKASARDHIYHLNNLLK